MAKYKLYISGTKHLYSHALFHWKQTTAAYILKLHFCWSRCDCAAEGRWEGLVAVSWRCATEHAPRYNNKLRPPSSCHPVKTKTPSLSADHTLHKPNKLFCIYPRSLTDATGTLKFPVESMRPRMNTRWWDPAPALTAQLLPKTSAKPMFTFTNPPPWQKHSNTVKPLDGLQLEGRCLTVIITIKLSRFLLSPLFGSCMQNEKKKWSAAMASFAALAFWKLLQPSPGNTLY